MRWNTSTFNEALDGAQLYVLPTGELQSGGRQTVETIKVWASLQAEHYRLGVVKQRRLAQEHSTTLQRVRQEHESRLATLREEQQGLPDAQWGRAALFLFAALVGLIAEWLLTWCTIPFMIDLKRRSVEAILLSLSPALATIGFDVILDRLVEGPWRAAQAHKGLRSDEHSMRAHRRMNRFLVALAILVTFMFLTLGIGRMAGAQWHTMLETGAIEALTTTQPIAVDIALVTLSLGVLFTTGLFLLLGMQEARTCTRRISIGRAVRRQERLVEQARHAEAEAVAEAERCEAKDARVAQLTTMIAQLTFGWHMEQLLCGRSLSQGEMARKVEVALNRMLGPIVGNMPRYAPVPAMMKQEAREI